MTVEVTIQGLGSGGDGITRLEDGRVIFVPGTLPGDRVAVTLTRVRKKIQYAAVDRMIESSPERVPSRCSVLACGGCVFRELSDAGQAEHKGRRVTENLRRIAGLDLSDVFVDFHPAPSSWHYRHRVRLQVRWSGESWQLGFFERGSHRLARFSGCPVMWPELERAVERVSEAVHRLPREAGLVEIRLTASRVDKRCAGLFVAKGDLGAFRKDLRWVEVSGLSGVEVQTPGGRWRHGNLEMRYDHGKAEEYSLFFEPSMFTQAFPEVNDALVQAVSRAVRPKGQPRVLELHSGIGNFSIPLARAGAKVVSFESNERAAIFAARNAALAGVSVEAHPLPDLEALGYLGDAEVLLMDPPRTGAKAVCEAIGKGAAASELSRIVYVSCDSATLARDTLALAQTGFRLISLTSFDMFPQTPHVEALAVLSR